ncbi:MAG: TetR/AcrR family transcriptional regulator [Microthrixaceae bacterium]|nr:TetR/AcrR family transcriptional regulator [Microthrixaceae bacterium]
MSKTWADSIAQHQEEARARVCAAAVELISERGLLSVTMAGIAARAGIARATLYKYFSDVDSVLLAWIAAATSQYLPDLAELANSPGQTPGQALQAVVRRHAASQREGPVLHVGQLEVASPSVADAARSSRSHLVELVAGVIERAQLAGDCRNDVSSVRLARYMLAAIEEVGGSEVESCDVAEVMLLLLSSPAAASTPAMRRQRESASTRPRSPE